jgi:hypothetical protein
MKTKMVAAMLVTLGVAACGGAGAQGAEGTGGGLPPGCDPSKVGGPVEDSCGMFVSPWGDDGNPGTKLAPVRTLDAALQRASTIYACASVTPYEKPVALYKAVTLFGGLDCSKGWAYDAAKKTQLTAGADEIPLTLARSALGSEVRDFSITAQAATAPGGSSIAVLDDGADLALTRCDIAAGKGSDGASGEVQAQVQTPSDADGKGGTDDAACNVSAVIPGGAGGTNTCSGTPTNGGRGGKGLPVSTGDDGSDGQPASMPGNGGSGQAETQACNHDDTQGTAGDVGARGIGARGIGDISASGYQPPVAAPGGSGTPGQGGGGGGAALACDAPAKNFSGPSGGGGGAGGCGGTAGNAGQSGGSSVGILALNAKLTLSTVTITAKTGGAGGLGGDGQRGGNGGQPGNAGGGASCGGGKGGQGGAGGPGGGGAGGHSIGIAAKGGTLPTLASTTIHHEAGAQGGAGGDMDMTAQTKGDGGLACSTIDFSKPASCMP